MHFTQAKLAVITICLVANFLHGCIAWVLLALIRSTEPARFDSQCVQVSNVAIYPQSVHNRVSETPMPWHANNSRLSHATPSGGMLRIYRVRKRHWLCRIQNIYCVRLSGSGRFTDGSFLATCPLWCCSKLQRGRLSLAKQKPTANQLQAERCQRITLHLGTTMRPLFPTCVTYMHSMFLCCKQIFIQVS